MTIKVNLDTVYARSKDVVAREVYGELIIIPITSGIGDLEDEILTLNKTGRAIWNKLDGRRSLKDMVRDLSSDFTGSFEEIKKDVAGFVETLLKRKILVENR